MAPTPSATGQSATPPSSGATARFLTAATGGASAQHAAVAARHIGRLRAQDLVHQAATATLTGQSSRVLKAGGLRVRLFLASPKNRRRENLGATGHLRFAHKEFAGCRLQSAHLSENISGLHSVSPTIA